MTKIAVVGVRGRMGTSILENAVATSEIEIVSGVEGPGDDAVGTTIEQGDVPVTEDFEEAFETASVVVDFSTPEACVEAADAAARFDCGFVSGTTGLSEEQETRVRNRASSIPVLRASNFSVGINLLLKLVGDASGATAETFDLEISESHHRNKVDAPSGTALSLGEAAADARDWDLDDVAVWGRKGEVGSRDDAEIGFQVVRGGSIVGEHTVALCGPGERIELTHRAGDRGIFAKGALRAARWLETRQPGIYSMQDVLFE